MEITNNFLSLAKERKWDYNEISDSLMKMMVSGNSGNWNAYAKCEENERQFLFYSVSGIKVPKDKRIKMMEFITRVNYGMKIGNFEINLENGEIRYKTSVQFGEKIKNDMIEYAVYMNTAIMDRYMPGVMKVCYSNLDLDDIINELE